MTIDTLTAWFGREKSSYSVWVSSIMYSVTVDDDEITVTDQATEWFVSYRHSLAMNGLKATNIVTDRTATVAERGAFLAVAFGKACDQALKLGWIV